VTRAEPLTRTVLDERLPRLQNSEKTRQAEAATHFHEATTFVGRIMMAVFAASGILVALLAIGVSRRLQRGLNVLKTGADALGAGRLWHRIRIHHKDELGDLAGAFNNMAGRLRSAQQQLRQRQYELEGLTQEAQAANRAKSQFLANMSHELRTPMNAIIGYSEMLTEEAEDLSLEQFIPDLRKIRIAGKQLLALINDILDLSKIEAGKIEFHYEEFEIAAIVGDVITISEPLASNNSNRLSVRVAPEIGGMCSDLTRVQQILFNLLSNACKFTHAGSVELSVEGIVWPGGDVIEFQVKDSGIGMSSVQMEKIFDAFAQADSSTTRKYGGTGLGLAITKRFCELMGGEIQVASELGEGAVFTVRLPRRGSSAGTGPASSSKDAVSAAASRRIEPSREPLSTPTPGA